MNSPVKSEGCSSSGSSSNDKQKQFISPLEVLNNRLHVLEQESVMMKKGLVVCMDERKEIMDETLQLFRTLCTHCRGSEIEHLLSNFYQETSNKNTGLLQALSKDSNPFLVSQGSNKADMFYKF